MRDLLIFRPGTHTDQSGATLHFGEADLIATAQAYNPALHEAPLVVGHPENNSPAWGWVTGLVVRNGQLLATPGQVDPQFAEAVNAGRYKKLSAAFYTPHAPTNPVPGIFYLRHVGFLGGQPPSLKGLGDAAFADQGDGVITVEFSESPSTKESVSMSDQDKTPIPPAPESDHAEKEKKLREEEVAFAERVRKFDEQEAAARAREDAAFAERMVKEGRVLPGEKSGVLTLLGVLGAGSDIVRFAEGDKTVQAAPKDLYRQFLEQLAPRIHFGEHARELPFEGISMVDLPPGYRVDPGRKALHQQALAYAEKHGVDFLVAACAVERTAPPANK
ncbi:hypothetical protein SIID45300_01057 [Candidatus Magnetaquicoccaceae bacterium FCR-1]|uniref:Peptidase n=1 Tax=Candidatus Magnetaquiglobus chichijimensis TaxID=3141448 RepID=A0ABQ0C781_9PROT